VEVGNVTLLHITGTHATLLPVYYREPDTLIKVGVEKQAPLRDGPVLSQSVWVWAQVA
jgi:hypothetical protein